LSATLVEFFDSFSVATAFVVVLSGGDVASFSVVSVTTSSTVMRVRVTMMTTMMILPPVFVVIDVERLTAKHCDDYDDLTTV
jgi:hypothetical protein